MSVSAEQLVGAWELVDFRVSFEDGREPVSPFGEAARGQIIYSASGRMSAILCGGDRAPLSVDGLERSAKAPVEEKAAAFDSYLSYAGTYELRGATVVHTVELGLVPNIVGLEQVRRVQLDGDDLVLSYDHDSSRGTQHYALRWRRI